MIERLRRLGAIFRWRGAGYFYYLVSGYLLPKMLRRLSTTSIGARVAARWRPKPGPPKSTGSPRSLDSELFPKADSWLPPATWGAVQQAIGAGELERVVIGRIDNDGRLLPHFGDVPGFDAVTSTEFVERYRYDVDLVVEQGVVLVRKDYRGDRVGFHREWSCLAQLAGVNAPDLFRAEPETTRLYKACVAGPTLRDRLVADGADILSVDTAEDPEIQAHHGDGRLEAVWRRGQAHLASLGEGFLDDLEARLESIHRSGVTGVSLTFGNVVLAGPEHCPVFVDFDSADVHTPANGLRFDLARDRDRRLFQRIYGRVMLTEASARRVLDDVATPYSPFDLGGGLSTPGFWSVDSGTGRWEVLNGPVLRDLLADRRVLDLGSFNALNPLLMLVDGARQVMAVEKDPEMIPRCQQLHRLFEWRYGRKLALDVHRADMRAILDADWGDFDLVTAFCSLYYLGEDDMARVVRRAAELAPILVLQAKTDTRENAGHGKAAKSSVSFLRSLLENEGFSNVEVVAPAGHTRPLLIGRRAYGA